MITNKGIAVLNYVTDALVQKFPIIVTAVIALHYP